MAMAPSGGAWPLRPLALPAAQKQADAVDVQGDHGKGDGTGEAPGALGQDPVEAAVPEVVDRRLHRRMLLAHPGEVLVALALAFRRVEIARLRQRAAVEQPVEADPVRGAVVMLRSFLCCGGCWVSGCFGGEGAICFGLDRRLIAWKPE